MSPSVEAVPSATRRDGNDHIRVAAQRFSTWWLLIVGGGVVTVSAVYVVVFAVKPRAGVVPLTGVLVGAVAAQFLIAFPLVSFSRQLERPGCLTLIWAALAPSAVLLPISIAANNLLTVIAWVGFVPPIVIWLRGRRTPQRTPSEQPILPDAGSHRTRGRNRWIAAGAVLTSLVSTMACVGLTVGYFRPVLNFGCLENPQWSPDGSIIAYGVACNVRLCNIDGRDVCEVIPRPQTRITTPDGQPGVAIPGLTESKIHAWSPDGNRLGVFGTFDESWPLKVPRPYVWKEFDLDASGELREVATCKFEISQPYFSSWSPGGRSIAYSRLTGSGTHVELGSADGCEEQLLMRTTTREKEFSVFPSWSSDGRQLAFASMAGPPAPDRDAGIWVANSDGTDLRNLTGPGPWPSAWPDWSPDGKTIAFFSLDPRNQGFWFMDPDGSNKRMAAPIRGQELWYFGIPVGGHAWSPDGGAFAYLAHAWPPDNPAELHVVKVSSMEDRVVFRFSNGWGEGLDWSPDGSEIVVAGTVSDDPGLFVVSPTGDHVRRIANAPAQWHLKGESTDL